MGLAIVLFAAAFVSVLKPGGSASALALSTCSPTPLGGAAGWATKAAPPQGVEGATGVIIGAKLYLTHGYLASSGDSATTHIYDLTANSWTTGANASVARSELVGVCAIDGGSAKVFAIGGRGGSGVLSTVEMYDPGANLWSARASMPTARAGLGAATDPSTNTIYAIGGRTGTIPESGTPLTVNEAYDPGTNTWSTKAPMPVAMADVYSTVYFNGKIYVIGGYDGTSVSHLVQIYNPMSDTWRSGAPMPTARSNLIAGVCGSAIYALGGYTGTNLATNEAYDPIADMWTPGQAPKPTASSEMAASVVSTGQEIFAVGSGAFGLSLDLNEMFTCAGNPTTPIPTSTPTATPTLTPTPTPCPTGKVPAGGGGCGTPTPTPTPCPTLGPDDFCLPGLDFSIGVGTQCDSTAGPMKCTLQTGETFTLDFKLNSIPAGFPYDGYDFTVNYNGVVANPASLVQRGPGVWPPCVFQAARFDIPGYVETGCARGVNAPSSTYVGTLARIDFQCPDAPATATVTLISSPRGLGINLTDVIVAVARFSAYHEAADESLTINCIAAPVGGISLDPHSDAARLETTGVSGLDRAGLAGAIAAVTMAALTAAAALWYWRRRA